VWEDGGTEDQAIAGLLHDAIEDAGQSHASIAGLPGVNCLGGSCQLRRRVSPCHPPAMAGGWRRENWPTPTRQSSLRRRVSDRHQASDPLAVAPAHAPPHRYGGAHEPADPTVRRQRVARHRQLTPGVRGRLAGS
jgi:hypothetical protein